ncbi:MAG: PIG-L family deacetylase [Planctomycetota bacterium]
MEEPLDVIAVGAHPDDIEIACGGTLAKLARQGYRVGIVDLTDGEPTPGSPGPESRLAEARQAAEILGVVKRVTLALPNRRLFDSFEARVALAKEFRRFRPRLVIGLGGKTPLASPDHYQAQLITEAAVFYSRLTKWDEHFDGLPTHPIAAYMNCLLALRSLGPADSGALVVDISDTLELKLKAIACYLTQFPPEKAHYFDRFRAFALQQGLAAGFAAGEVLISPVVIGTRDLMGLLFGPRP